MQQSKQRQKSKQEKKPKEIQNQQQNQCQEYTSYKLVKKIGQGSFGKAYLVQSSMDKKQYIMKKLQLSSTSLVYRQSILQQVLLMQSLNHIYIIKYRQSYVEDKCVCLVMDYAENGDLEKFVEKNKQKNKHIQQDQVVKWFVQLCIGLKYIHQKKILHRDLKADNIFITKDNQIQIGDFGVSKVMNQTYDLAKTKIGTPHIMAPEIFDNMKYNQKSDIWSLGCVLYKLLTFKYPFQSMNILAMMAKMQNKKIQPIQGPYSKQLKQLTYELLSFSPNQRPTVHKILQKPFIKRYLQKILQNSIRIHTKVDQAGQGTSITPKKQYLSSEQSLKRLGSKRSSLSLTPLISPLSKNQIPSRSFYNQNHNRNENIKMIQFKQNYPILVEENKLLKEENSKHQKDKENLQQEVNKILQKTTNMTKEQIVDMVRNTVLHYVYK